MRCLMLVVIAARATTAFADEFATSPARPEYMASEKLLMFERRAELEARGLVIDGAYAFELFIAPQLREPAAAAGLFTLELDASLDKLVSKRLGSIHASAFAIHGDSITDELMDIHGTSGNAAPRDVRLFEAWIEQPLGPLTLRAGLIAADQELVIADRAGTLLAATFGITSQFSANVLGPVYPVAAPGVSVRVLEGAPLSARAAIYDGALANTHGIPTGLGPAYLVVGEVILFDRLKLGAWHHDERGEAIYAIADAQVSERVGAFARVGVSNGAVGTYIDAGVRASPVQRRPDDFLSMGLAYADTEDGVQTIFETSYEAQIAWFSLHPAVQLLLLREQTVALFATRMTVTF